MATNDPSPVVSLPEAELDRIQELYDRCLYVQAFRLAEQLGPLRNWHGTRGRVLAGRLANNLGAQRLARWHHIHAFREHPGHPKTRAYYAHIQLERRGPCAALQLLEQWGNATGDDEDHHYLCTLRAHSLAMLRDFSRADEWLKRAEAMTSGPAWVRTERANWFEQQDRYEEALAEARRSFEITPWYRPAVQHTAHLLQILNRDDEALDLMQQALGHIESAPVAAQLAMLQMELGHYENALASLQCYEELAPLLEKVERKWLAGQRARAAYQLGDRERAASLLSELDDEYHKAFVQRLTDPAAPDRRVRLAVQFVRQHHVTCAPATLSALSRFWNRPAEHLEVSEAICYDGTPAHSERHWAETNGWVVREFTVTWESAVALLDRGLPFTLTTTEATSGHLQAAIGYDELRQTILLRDPYQYYAREVIVEPFFKRYAAHGPRGMVIVPPQQQGLLDEIDLPDAALYDRLHRVNRALVQHDRPGAATEVDGMSAAEPHHRLTLTARRVLAAYDANTPALLEILDALLELHPDDANLQLCKVGCLRELGRREERVAWLEDLCARPECDPVFWQQFAQELRPDARDHGVALHWVRRSLKWRPLEPAHLSTLADFLWDQRRFAEATELYRFAACLEAMKEPPARAYFVAARSLRQTDAALAFLRERYDRLGHKSAQPALTLSSVLEQLDRQPEAFKLLEEALHRRPDDAELLLAAADAFARYGERAKAQGHLRRAEGKCQRTRWLRTAASLEAYAASPRTALAHWREVLALEPLAMDAHRAVAALLAETEGSAAALAHLAGVTGRFPHNYPLHQLLLDWTRDEGPAAVEPVLRRMLASHPGDAWSLRELSAVLVQQGRCEEALAAAEEGVRREPQWTFSHSMLGSVHEQRGEPARAQECYREAIRLSVDNGYAVEHLMATCHTLAGRREALRFIEEELIRQVVFGDGLLAFRDVARGILDPNELLASLQAALDARPDLWHAWSAMILQLIDLQRAEDAVALAREATERFPLLPRIWLDLAAAERARLDPGEEAALQQALRINPDWGIAARQLAGCYERKGEFEKACALLEGLCARAPLDAFNHGALAEVLWRLGRRDEALEKLQLALRLQPGFEWGWQLLLRWAGELGRPGLALEMARDLTVRRAGEASVWLVLARCLEEAGEEQELFTALDQAIALQPRSTDASDLKAALLARHRRFAEALAACQPAVFGEHPPPELRGRAAWVEAERGNLPRAISLMQAVLAENPAYFWGWQQLTDWLWRDNQHDEAVRAAEKMTTLAPFEPSPLGYLADLKVRKDDREGAKRDLARALKVDPAYAYAGFQLFDLHLEDRELPAAAEILGHLQRHIGGDLVQARAAQLAIRQRGCDQAQELFRDLCASRKEENIWPVSVVADELAGASLGQTAERILREALDQPDPPGRVAQVWVKRRLDLHQWWCQGKLRQLKDRGEAGRLAVLQYLDSLGDAILACQSKQDVTGRLALQFHFWRLLRTHRCWLAKDDLGWGKVGYVLANLGWHRRLVKWLGDWRERPGAESWMLHNLVLALHALGRDAEADAVVRQALARPAFGDLRARLLLWAAVEDALSGRLEAAKALLEGLRAEHTPADEQSLFRLVNLVLAFEQAAIQPPEFARAERAMMKEFLDQHPNNRTMQRVFLRALRRISERTGSRWPLWWGCGKRYQPALIAAAIGMAFLALKVLALSGGS